MTCCCLTKNKKKNKVNNLMFSLLLSLYFAVNSNLRGAIKVTWFWLFLKNNYYMSTIWALYHKAFCLEPGKGT